MKKNKLNFLDLATPEERLMLWTMRMKKVHPYLSGVDEIKERDRFQLVEGWDNKLYLNGLTRERVLDAVFRRKMRGKKIEQQDSINLFMYSVLLKSPGHYKYRAAKEFYKIDAIREKYGIYSEDTSNIELEWELENNIPRGPRDSYHNPYDYI